jgi:toxin CcdB
MAQFDVYPNPNEATNGLFPYLMDITNPLFSSSKLRVVIPLCNDGAAIRHLNPTFTINGEECYLSIMDIAGVPATLCGDPVANLENRRSEIVDAVDFLVNGF